MTRRPFIKFFTSDWLGDVKLQACSLAARGLWIELICRMHEAKPYGHLLIDGKPPSYYRIAQAVRSDHRVVKNLMAELKKAGVFTGDITSEITSRRMVRDELKRQQVQEVGNYPVINYEIAPYHPYSRKKERGPTKESKGSIIDPNPRRVGRIKAQHRIERDLLQQLGEEGYARAIEALAANPELVDRATKMEQRTPGSGVMAAMLGLRQKA